MIYIEYITYHDRIRQRVIFNLYDTAAYIYNDTINAYNKIDPSLIDTMKINDNYEFIQMLSEEDLFLVLL